MKEGKRKISRRKFLQGTAAVAAVTIVPRHVLGMAARGGSGQRQPSETLGGALIGCGDRGGETFNGLGGGVRRLASCDVKYKDRADDKTFYTDYRKVLERKDIDVVAIATHPGWHALISIAAMEAGKDVLCEKPMCRFIAEGFAVAEAEKRYGRIWQVGTYGRFGSSRKLRKIFESGLLKECTRPWSSRAASRSMRGAAWSSTRLNRFPPSSTGTCIAARRPAAVPEKSLRRQPSRLLGLRRGRIGRHGPPHPRPSGLRVRPRPYLAGRNHSYAPPLHPECCMVWGYVEMKYADGFKLVFESGEWGKSSGRAVAEHRRRRPPQDAQRSRPQEAPSHARASAAIELQRGRQDPQAGRRKRRGLGPRGLDLPSHEHRHALRAEDPLRPRQKRGRRRRGSQSSGLPADARAWRL